jgi:hypothetical protein
MNWASGHTSKKSTEIRATAGWMDGTLLGVFETIPVNGKYENMREDICWRHGFPE